jgi:hypothetical protein
MVERNYLEDQVPPRVGLNLVSFPDVTCSIHVGA